MFRSARPDLAEAGGTLLYQYGVGLAYLGTVRPDGGPRLHSICPVLTDEELHAFIVPSPKLRDLVRDGRFALHSFATETNEDAFYVTGSASRVEDAVVRSRLEEQFRDERPDLALSDLHDQGLFRFLIEVVLLTRTTGHGDPHPRHEVWRARSMSPS